MYNNQWQFPEDLFDQIAQRDPKERNHVGSS